LDFSLQGSAVIVLGVVVDVIAAASSSPVRQAAIVTRASLAAKAVALSSPLGAPSPYPTAPVSLARPPYERLAALATYARFAAEAAALLSVAAALAASAHLAVLTLASTVRPAAIFAHARLGAEAAA
jgi:hypothetical protein